MTGIERTDDILGGEPRIEGTRIGVLDVYEFIAAGDSAAETADQLDCTLAEIYAALSYYHEHPEEMRELRRDRDDIKAVLAEEALPHRSQPSDSNVSHGRTHP